MKFRFVIGFAVLLWVFLVVADAKADPPPRDPDSHPFCVPWVDSVVGEKIVCRNDYQRLNEVASIFAMRPIVVNCYTEEAWEGNWYFFGTWGVTFFSPDFKSIEMPELLCQELIGLTEQKIPEVRWRAALAVLVMVHESYHSRLWRWRQDEKRVHCKAIRHWRVGLGLLWGYDNGDLYRELWPHAVALYYRQGVKIPVYEHRGCRIQYP